jgi:ligand-binding SRPBCC domain-containing protein
MNEEEIAAGMKIDYTVKPLWGIAMSWQSEICNVQNQKYFTDRQAKGPYKIWDHMHRFSEVEV